MTKQLSPSVPATTDTTPHGSPGEMRRRRRRRRRVI